MEDIHPGHILLRERISNPELRHKFVVEIILHIGKVIENNPHMRHVNLWAWPAIFGIKSIRENYFKDNISDVDWRQICSFINSI